MATVPWGGIGPAFVVAAVALAACAVPVQAQQRPMATSEVVRQVDPSIIAYLDNVALADQSLQFAVWTQRIAAAQAPALLQERAAQLAGLDLRGLDPSVVAEHRAAMTQLMQQIEWAIAASNSWPPERAPGDYRAIAQRTLQRLRADYDQKLARGIAPTATAPALLVVFAWTRGEAQPAMADWLAGEQQRIHDVTEAILTGVAASAATPRPGSTSPPGPNPTQAASTPATSRPSAPSGAVPIHNNPGFGSWQVGMDIFNGADYRSFHIPTADPALCLAECARDTRCRAVTYTMPGTYGAAQAACWLKGQTGTFGPHASAISAVKLGATTPPPAATPPPVATTPPPVAAKPPVAAIPQYWLGDWLFRGIAGQRANIRQTSDGVLFVVTERNERAVGRVESASTIVIEFPFASGLRGTLSADGRRIDWANGEFWTREASSPAIAPVVKPPLAQCDIGGQWRMDTRNVGQSTWTFSPLGGNRYSGQEAGLGNASGTASVNGNSLRLEWRTGGYSGVVELTLDASCSSGQGRQVFYTGRTGSEASMWTRIGAVATPPATAGSSLAGQWNGPLGIYEMTQTGNNFTWRVGSEVGQGTISGDNLQVSWTGGGSATGRITGRTPQGLPIAIAWSNGVVFKRVGH